jgi:hypothetical protein
MKWSIRVALQLGGCEPGALPQCACIGADLGRRQATDRTSILIFSPARVAKTSSVSIENLLTFPCSFQILPLEWMIVLESARPFWRGTV